MVKTEERFNKARKKHEKSVKKIKDNALNINKVWEEKKHLA